PGAAPSSTQSGGRQYTGKELDNTGLYYYGARYYDPETGRFAQADTVIPGAAPQAYNRYSYTLNNPLRYVDPSGHAPMTGDPVAEDPMSSPLVVSPMPVAESVRMPGRSGEQTISADHSTEQQRLARQNEFRRVQAAV